MYRGIYIDFEPQCFCWLLVIDYVFYFAYIFNRVNIVRIVLSDNHQSKSP
jgi:hypothetical protein